MKSKRQTNGLEEFILPQDQNNDRPAQELAATTAGGCTVQTGAVVLPDDIIGRVQEYAQPVDIVAEELNTSDVAQSATISADQPALRELADRERAGTMANLTKAIFEIQKFQGNFPTPLKPANESEIKHIAWRISRHPDDWLAWYKIMNRSSAYSMKAKLRRYLANSIRSKIAELEETVRKSPLDAKLACEQAAGIYSEILLANEHGIFDGHSRDEVGRWREWRTNNETPGSRKKVKKPSKCKRQIPNRLPAGWQETIARALGYDPTVDLYICCGNRPSEVRSARLSMIDDLQLAITIKASKLPENSGEEYREIAPNMHIPAARRLASVTGDIDFSQVNTDVLRARMSRASRKLWGIAVTPMCFRHALAGQIKEIDGPLGDRVTKVLAHTSNRTDSRYGTRTGKARIPKRDALDPLASVSASRPIRETRSSKYRGRQAIPNRVQTLPGKSPKGDKS
jgi:integrase